MAFKVGDIIEVVDPRDRSILCVGRVRETLTDRGKPAVEFTVLRDYSRVQGHVAWEYVRNCRLSLGLAMLEIEE